MTLPESVTLCECWARDGLQSIPRTISTADKVELINRIIDSGVRKLEVTSFSHPKLLPQFAEIAPYNVILVALEEDPTIRMVGNLVARAGGPIDEIDPSEIEIGAAVRVVFERIDDAISLPRWVLDPAPG